MIQKENRLSDELALNIQYKIRLMKEEIINIKYAIHWAKAGIVNSLILSESEIKLAIDTIEKENLPYSTPEEALDFANVKIISNDQCLLYIIYIPLTTTELYDKLLLKPVKKNNSTTDLEYNNIIKSHENIYSIINECRTINLLSICNQKNILDIRESPCLPNLLKSRPSKCNRTNDQHVPTVEEIAEGVILLNQYNGEIGLGHESQSLNGTYLIKFSNTSISVNSRVFISKESSTIRVLPAILQPTPQEDEFKETLSLQMMKDLNINNLDQIKLLQDEKNNEMLTSYSILVIVIIITSIIIISMKCKRNREIKIINNTEVKEPSKKEVEDLTEIGGATNLAVPKTTVEQKSLPVTSKRKFYETPFF